MTDYSQFEKKNVIIVKASPEGGDAVEVEAELQTANAGGILYREKGKSRLDLIPADEVIEVRLAPQEPAKVRIKKLAILALGKARQHLVTDHGYKVSEISKLSEDEAFAFHGGLDHTDLGHAHAAKSEKPAED